MNLCTPYAMHTTLFINMYDDSVSAISDLPSFTPVSYFKDPLLANLVTAMVSHPLTT